MEMDKPMIRRILGFMMSISLLLGLLPGLTQIRLPKNCAISDTAFTGCTGLIAVYAPAGGTTEAWCIRADIPFVGE